VQLGTSVPSRLPYLNHELKFCQVSRRIFGSIARVRGGGLHPVCSALSARYKANNTPNFRNAMYSVQPFCIQQKTNSTDVDSMLPLAGLVAWCVLSHCSQCFWTGCVTLLHVALHLFSFSFSFFCFFHSLNGTHPVLPARHPYLKVFRLYTRRWMLPLPRAYSV